MNQRLMNRMFQRLLAHQAFFVVALMFGCVCVSSAWTQDKPVRQDANGTQATKGGETAKGTEKASEVVPQAAAEVEGPLYEQEPYDVVTLDEQNKNAKLKIAYVPLPNRRLPINPPPDSKLIVRLLENPDEEFEIAWRFIVRVDLYEEMLLAAGNRLVQDVAAPPDGRTRSVEEKAALLDEAFPYFFRLQQLNPQWPGLKESFDRYLFYDAGNLTAQKRLAEALSVIEELYRRNPTFRLAETLPPISEIMSRVLDRILNSYFEEKNYLGIRSLLKSMNDRYGNQKPAAVDTWSARLKKLAAEKRDEGRGHIEKGQYRDAIAAVQAMKNLWPDIEQGKQLQTDVAAAYPIVFVGVTQPALDDDAQRLDNWPARRTGRLVHRTLVEFLGAGPEGGEYQLSLGSIDHSDDRRKLIFRLNQQAAEGALPVTGYDVNRRIIQLATPGSPDYSPTWHSLLVRSSVKNVFTVEMEFRRPHVLPEALLRVPFVPRAANGSSAVEGDGAFRVQLRTEQETQFKNKSFAAGSRLAEIVELRFDQTQKALGALRRGEIDVLDRMFPADALRVRGETTEASPIRVEPYALPTVHMIVPNDNNPFLKNREFRRALVVAINRENILRQELMGGRDYEGFRVISGPFPASSGDADPLGYAYDEAIPPMPYNPLLAKAISLVAQKQTIETAKKRGDPEPKIGKFVLGFPGHEMARVACQAIAAQWQAIGLVVELHEFPPGVSTDEKGECDLTYKEVAIWEPATDAHRMLGARGVAPTQSPYVLQSLRWLEFAQNWGEVRDRLIDIHRAVNNDVAILPLWQTVDFFAYQKRLVNIGSRPVWLYQSVDQWRISLEGSAG